MKEQLLKMPGFREKIMQVVTDKAHGSNYLLDKLLKILKHHRDDTTKKDLHWVFDQLDTMDPALAIIHHFVSGLKSKIGARFFKYLDTYVEQWSSIAPKLAGHLNEAISLDNKTILTHSHSGTIQKVFIELYLGGKSFKIMQTESLPGGEGALQAKALSDLKIPVQLISESQVYGKCEDVDLLMIGCDQFTGTDFINKAGTKKLLAFAEHSGIPVFILSDTRKKVHALDLVGEMFEIVPMEHHISIITEKGLSRYSSKSC